MENVLIFVSFILIIIITGGIFLFIKGLMRETKERRINMRNAFITTYSKELKKPVPFDDKKNAMIHSIEVDVLIIPDKEDVKIRKGDFVFKVKDKDIELESPIRGIYYVLLPYSVMVSVGGSPIYEKIVVGNWVCDNLLNKLNEEEYFGNDTEFRLRNEGGWNVNLTDSR